MGGSGSSIIVHVLHLYTILGVHETADIACVASFTFGTVLCVLQLNAPQKANLFDVTNAWAAPLCSHRPPAGELFGSAAMVCVDILCSLRLALQTRFVTISPSSPGLSTSPRRPTFI